MLRNLSDEERRITAENTKKFISRAAIGSVIRVASAPSTDSQFANDDAWYSTDPTPCLLDDGVTPKYAHSIILVDKSDTGFTYMHDAYDPLKNVDDVVGRYDKAIPGTRIRPDVICEGVQTVYELKPFCVRNLKKGLKQAANYADVASGGNASGWTIVVDMYVK